MIDNPAPPAARSVGGRCRSLLREAFFVALAGAASALLANQLSPRGLKLARDYFPGGIAPLTVPPARMAEAANTTPPLTALAARLQEKGLHLAGRAQVEQLFHDPRLQQNLVLFIDARDENHYQEGHIPGAYEFFPYHPEKYLAEVMPLCQIAEQIVVYCAGGECEDSESAALYLQQAGIPAEKLFVYGGGITDWAAAGLAVERGARNSGDLEKPAR
jgi:rhodanese-related sulfurtransferase